MGTFIINQEKLRFNITIEQRFTLKMKNEPHLLKFNVYKIGFNIDFGALKNELSFLLVQIGISHENILTDSKTKLCMNSKMHIYNQKAPQPIKTFSTHFF